MIRSPLVPLYLCRWPNSDVSVVQARSKPEAIIRLVCVAGDPTCELGDCGKVSEAQKHLLPEQYSQVKTHPSGMTR